MSSDKFDFIITEIPKNIDKDMVKDLFAAAKKIDAEESLIINKILKLDTEGVIEESLNEDDLFELGEDSLKTKKVVQDFLFESITNVIVPMMYNENRTSSPLNSGDFSYVSINEKTYAVSGQHVSYYSTKMNPGYMYVLALSLSDILSDFLKD
tara:strand:- start:118 stop:576 length:459 start_codon:yes stop_codon:yes gene_type:complete